MRSRPHMVAITLKWCRDVIAKSKFIGASFARPLNASAPHIYCVPMLQYIQAVLYVMLILRYYFVQDSRTHLSIAPVSSKHVFKILILENTSENTGCLLQLSNYWLACIFQHSNNTRQKTKYCLLTCDEGQTIKLFEQFDCDSFIDKICNIVTQKLKCEEI